MPAAFDKPLTSAPQVVKIALVLPAASGPLTDGYEISRPAGRDFFLGMWKSMKELLKFLCVDMYDLNEEGKRR